MIAIYHNKDLDGFASAAIVKSKYPDAKLIGYDYGQNFNFNLVKNKDVIMVDVSLPMKDMQLLGKTAKTFVWIDHHISVIKDYEKFVDEYGEFGEAILDNGIAACESIYKYLYTNKEIPLAIKLLGEYDTWRNADSTRWENEILPFQYGMRAICNSPLSFPVNLLSSSAQVKDIIKQGNIILKYQSKIDELKCEKGSFEITFDGLTAICLNTATFNSKVFESVYDEKIHDVMIPFQFNGDFWNVSLYTTKENVDCSVLAKARGGGGHKKASGFHAYNTSNDILSKLLFRHNSKYYYSKETAEIDAAFNSLDFEKAYKLFNKLKSNMKEFPKWMKDYEQRIDFTLNY